MFGACEQIFEGTCYFKACRVRFSCEAIMSANVSRVLSAILKISAISETYDERAFTVSSGNVRLFGERCCFNIL
jgi:hypothetical protein